VVISNFDRFRVFVKHRVELTIVFQSYPRVFLCGLTRVQCNHRYSFGFVTVGVLMQPVASLRMLTRLEIDVRIASVKNNSGSRVSIPTARLAMDLTCSELQRVLFRNRVQQAMRADPVTSNRHKGNTSTVKPPRIPTQILQTTSSSAKSLSLVFHLAPTLQPIKLKPTAF